MFKSKSFKVITNDIAFYIPMIILHKVKYVFRYVHITRNSQILTIRLATVYTAHALFQNSYR
jgi:hypothetical protein